MRLHDTLVSSGNRLFRWRSYTPLLLIPLLFLERGAIRNGGWVAWQGDLAYEIVCLSVVFLGLAIRALTIGFVAKGTSGRNTKRQVATHLNETGAYSVVRNPLYVGNYFVVLGITLMTQSWALAVINSFLFAAAYIPIILAEEDFLTRQFGDRYLAYANRVPCLIPNLRLWRPPALPFSLRMVLRREHDTWMTAAAGIVVMALYRDWTQTSQLRFDQGWIVAGLLSLAVWLVFKAVKLWTGLLHERVQPA
jgi:protein-S-isoprenylcysteine O-methyltransferase Ste14